MDDSDFTCDIYCDETVAGRTSMVILALYGNDGQFLGCTTGVLTLENGKNRLEISAGSVSYESCKLILVDNSVYTPLLSNG